MDRITLRKNNRGLVGIIVFFLLNLCLFSSSQAADGWQNEVSIYGWYAGIDGEVTFPGGSETDVTVEASDILENLNMIFMGGYQGKYDRWSIIADVVYMDVGGRADKPLVLGAHSVDLDIKSWVLNGGVGYDLVQSDSGILAIVGGARYLALDAEIDLGILGNPIIERSGSEGLLDGVIGLRGHLRLTDNWYLPFHADIGAGNSDLTWQLFGAIGYRFSWGDIKLGYRHLVYDLGDDKVMVDLRLSGPVLGVGFRF